MAFLVWILWIVAVIGIGSLLGWYGGRLCSMRGPDREGMYGFALPGAAFIGAIVHDTLGRLAASMQEDLFLVFITFIVVGAFMHLLYWQHQQEDKNGQRRC